MFASLFSSKSSDSARDISAAEAMAALMVRIAKSDDEYSAARNRKDRCRAWPAI